MPRADLSAQLYAFCLGPGIMHHPVHTCREKSQEPLQLHWLERILGVLWGEIKIYMYKQ